MAHSTSHRFPLLVPPGLGRWLLLFTAIATLTAAPEDYFAIQVVDATSGRGLPLVDLRMVNEAAWWTDSNGLVAFNEPGAMDREVYFHVASPGYEQPADGFGYRGVKLRPVRGGSATIRLTRLNIAERLYRVTGAGIYRDSVLLGRNVPTERPVLNGEVTGQDTVVTTPYAGKIYWFWGDTGRLSYPLGHFGVSGATSEPPDRGGLDPAVGVNLTYFVDARGFSRPMCPEPNHDMRWIEGPVVVPDEQGRARLVSRLAVQKHLGDAAEWHLMVFNDEAGRFDSVARWDLHDPHQSAHPRRVRVGGVEYWYLFPEYRVRAELRAMRDLDNYEAFTCIASDGRWRGDDTTIDRDANGRAQFHWKAGADRLWPNRLNQLGRQKKLQPEEAWHERIDFESGRPLKHGIASFAWNEHRRRWIAFFADQPGDVWFAEADTPTGPWGYARKIADHGAYNFYNLAHHAFFDQQGGRRVYFEGTYTEAFSAAKARTPRYDYNQIMYALDLTDERLQLPVAVYRVRASDGTETLRLRDRLIADAATDRVEDVAFFALPPECARVGTVRVFADRSGSALTLTAPNPDARPLFVALPADPASTAKGPEGLWQCRARADNEEGDGIGLTLRMTPSGDRWLVKSTTGGLDGTGTLLGGRLELKLTSGDDAFECEATVQSGRLAGKWRKIGASDTGTWSGALVDTTPAEWRSPALVALRQFRRTENGMIFHSTASAAPTGSTATGSPLCRVWRATHPTGPWDWSAQPLP